MSSRFGVIMHDDHEFIGATIAGRYRIISKLGAGGMGVAYRAWDEQVGMPVVIKIPKRIFLEDAGFAERFQREIRLLQGLKHPHIVPILDVGDHEGLPFVVMRLLPGGSLSNRRLRDDKGKPRPNKPAMLHLWLPAVADALDYVYSQGVVHRDVKPANIFFDAFWGAYLGDFGIAKIVEESDTFDREHTLTATQMGIGTQEYMAPEQFAPKAVVDGRADQYALAVIVYEILAGERPFTGATAHIVVEVTTYPVPPLPVRQSDVSPLVVQAVHKALAKHPAERFGTCREFATAVLRDVPPMTDEPGVVRLLCPNDPCNNLLVLRTDYAGRKGKCPKCQEQIKVGDDLGALWLLDEARRQKSKRDSGDNEKAGNFSESTDSGEDSVEEFEPISSISSLDDTGRVSSVLRTFLIRLRANLREVAARLTNPGPVHQAMWISCAWQAVMLLGFQSQRGRDLAPYNPYITIISEAPDIVEDFEEFEEQPLEPQPYAEQVTDGVVLPDDAVVENVQVVAVAADIDAAAVSVEFTDFSTETAASSDLLTSVGAIGGQAGGLGGRTDPTMRKKLVQAGGGNAQSEAAVEAALKWIINHQLPDGAWSFNHAKCPSCNGNCSHSGKIEDRGGATAMALLPMLGRGYTHKEGPYKKQFEAGIGFLASLTVKGQGKAYEKEKGGNLYCQGLAGIALSETYAMTQDKRLQGPAQFAINYIMAAQDPVGGGWRYEPKQPGDTSASGWQLMALKSGHMAFLKVDELTIKKAVGFLNHVQQDDGSRYGYTDATLLENGYGTSAAGLLCRMYLGWKKDNPALQRGAMKLAKKGPATDLYFDYYATQVLHHIEGDAWVAWNTKMRDMLVTSQQKKGHAAGSWCEGFETGHGPEQGGRLYCTSMATMILEVYYRHLPLYGQQSINEEFKE